MHVRTYHHSYYSRRINRSFAVLLLRLLLFPSITELRQQVIISLFLFHYRTEAAKPRPPPVIGGKDILSSQLSDLQSRNDKLNEELAEVRIIFSLQI